MGAARHRFRQAIEDEILRRVEHESGSMTRAELEEIGVNAGLPRERVEREFLRLAGTVWAGHIHPENGPSFPVFAPPPRQPLGRWVAVDFPRQWFQEEGMLSQPPVID